MSTIPWKLEKDLCRCCHAEGNFHNLAEPGLHSGRTEVYLDMLKSSLDVDINPVEGMLYAMTFAICEGCIVRLRDATSFKQQVLSCEERFREMYAQYINAFKPEVKIEPKEPEEVKVEELDDQQAFDVNFTDSDDDDKPLLKKILMSQPVKKKASSGRARGRPRKLQSVPKKKTNKKPKKVEIEDTEDEPNHSGDEMEEEQTEPAGAVEPKKEKKKKEFNKHGVKIEITDSEDTTKGSDHDTSDSIDLSDLSDDSILNLSDDALSDDSEEISDSSLSDSENERKDSDNTISDNDLEDETRGSVVEIDRHCKKTDDVKEDKTEDKRDLTTKSTLRIKKKQRRVWEMVKDWCIKHTIKERIQYECLRCKKSLKSVQSFYNHYERYHLISTQADNSGNYRPYQLKPEDAVKDGKDYVCQRCGKRFAKRDSVRCHVMVHLKVGKYTCQSCEEGFATKRLHLEHKFRVHGVDERFKCNACDAGFFRTSYLEQHMKEFHMLGEKYKCDVCDFETFKSAAIKKHKVKHNPVKIFECRFCKKSFARKTNLNQHEKIHTGDKRKVCKVCSEAFVQKASLNYHMTKYHPDVHF